MGPGPAMAKGVTVEFPAFSTTSPRLQWQAEETPRPSIAVSSKHSELEDAYRFTIDAGIVTAVYENDDGIWKLKTPEDGETYTVDPNDSTVVVRTKLEHGNAETERFVSSDGGQTFVKVEDHGVGGSGGGPEAGEDLYRFQFDGADAITAVSRLDHGIWKSVRLDSNETYTVDPVVGRTRVIKTEIEHDGTKTDIFDDSDANGDYVELDSAQKPAEGFYVGAVARDVFKGGKGADEMYGDGGDDDLSGDDGDDDVFGDDGDDSVSGGNGSDELNGGRGNDHLNGDAGDDVLHGQDGNDDLNGGDGNDDLQGETGVDRLTGGLGADRLKGGLAADTFAFGSSDDSGVGAQRDVVVDFNTREKDRIDLSAIDANENLIGNQTFTWLGKRAFSGTAGQLHFSVLPARAGLLVQGDLDGDKVPDFEVSLLGANKLGAGQILL